MLIPFRISISISSKRSLALVLAFAVLTLGSSPCCLEIRVLGPYSERIQPLGGDPPCWLLEAIEAHDHEFLAPKARANTATLAQVISHPGSTTRAPHFRPYQPTTKNQVYRTTDTHPTPTFNGDLFQILIAFIISSPAAGKYVLPSSTLPSNERILLPFSTMDHVHSLLASFLGLHPYLITVPEGEMPDPQRSILFRNQIYFRKNKIESFSLFLSIFAPCCVV